MTLPRQTTWAPRWFVLLVAGLFSLSLSVILFSGGAAAAFPSNHDSAVSAYEGPSRLSQVARGELAAIVGADHSWRANRGAGPKASGSVAVSGFVVAAKSAAAVEEAGAGAAKAEQYLYRVHGGESGPMGHSWTPQNPMGMANPRSSLGLPKGNSGQMLTRARVLNDDGVMTRGALPLDGNPGGAPEWLIPDPATQLAPLWTIPLVPSW